MFLGLAKQPLTTPSGGDDRCLGTAERADFSLADFSSKPDAPSLLHAEITAENWTKIPKARRVVFLRDQRQRDPAAARALLEGVFKSEPAAVRADLLAALDVGLGANDLAFWKACRRIGPKPCATSRCGSPAVCRVHQPLLRVSPKRHAALRGTPRCERHSDARGFI
jgi:hypothetical protein